ncbi:riboflavin kinase [Paenibacillus pini JCM 16418]|uniref:Bifunctional riboflavin kinase/FMN adenylyltransferase n=1 Tax=Paenibacillus pini JCM 16418 TaxID=1236976 RepID=W7YQP1_9BACL|nr:riboflavin kinase [Paenibacillus pini JCM 16418]
MKTVNLSYPLSQDIAREYAHPQVVAIGQFDGVHLGHASVISSAVRQARQAGVPAAVMTFHPHPKDVMKKGDYDGNLTPLHEKQLLLQELGVETLYVVEFNDAFSHVSPFNFVEGMLFPLQIHTAVVGFDFRFGHKGEGNADMLRELGQTKMLVETIPPFLLGGEKVSSSVIRQALQSGDLVQVNHLLGRNYRLRGTVIDGDKRGRTIGFPTANLSLTDRFVVPAKEFMQS